MKFIICLSIFCLVQYIASTPSDVTVTKLLCRKTITQQNRLHRIWIGECIEKLGYTTTRQKVQKSTCLWKCVLENLSMLNEQGFIDTYQYDKYLEKNWPSTLVAAANYTFQPCLKFGGTPRVQDETCSGYTSLVKCLNRNYSLLCKDL